MPEDNATIAELEKEVHSLMAQVRAPYEAIAKRAVSPETKALFSRLFQRIEDGGKTAYIPTEEVVLPIVDVVRFIDQEIAMAQASEQRTVTIRRRNQTSKLLGIGKRILGASTSILSKDWEVIYLKDGQNVFLPDTEWHNTITITWHAHRNHPEDKGYEEAADTLREKYNTLKVLRQKAAEEEAKRQADEEQRRAEQAKRDAARKEMLRNQGLSEEEEVREAAAKRASIKKIDISTYSQKITITDDSEEGVPNEHTSFLELKKHEGALDYFCADSVLPIIEMQNKGKIKSITSATAEGSAVKHWSHDIMILCDMSVKKHSEVVFKDISNTLLSLRRSIEEEEPFESTNADTLFYNQDIEEPLGLQEALWEAYDKLDNSGNDFKSIINIITDTPERDPDLQRWATNLPGKEIQYCQVLVNAGLSQPLTPAMLKDLKAFVENAEGTHVTLLDFEELPLTLLALIDVNLGKCMREYPNILKD